MLILDTNVVSELRKVGIGKGDANLKRWAERTDPATLFLSAITVQELAIGVSLIARRDVAQGKLLRAWLEERVLPEFSHRILPVDVLVAQRSAALHVPNARPLRDGFIAATALVHGMAVVTRKVRDFVSTGARIVDPWAAP